MAAQPQLKVSSLGCVFLRKRDSTLLQLSPPNPHTHVHSYTGHTSTQHVHALLSICLCTYKCANTQSEAFIERKTACESYNSKNE